MACCRIGIFELQPHHAGLILRTVRRADAPSSANFSGASLKPAVEMPCKSHVLDRCMPFIWSYTVALLSEVAAGLSQRVPAAILANGFELFGAPIVKSNLVAARAPYADKLAPSAL